MLSDLTECAVGKGNLCAGAAAAAGGLMDGACRCTSDSRAVDVAVKGISETAERGEAVISDTEPADSTTVSIEGRARQTDWDVAGLIWTSPLV